MALLPSQEPRLLATRAETATQTRVATATGRAAPRRRRIKWGPIVTHGVLLTACAVILFPLVWVALLSIKSLPDAYTNRIWPHHFDFGSYHRALTAIDTLPQNFENSIVVTVATMVITTTIAVLAGYALVHLPTPGKRIILGIFVASLFVPSRVTGLISIWEIQDRLGLINNTWGLILPYQTLALAVSVFIMRGVFETIPKELPESAGVDGASSFMIRRRLGDRTGDLRAVFGRRGVRARRGRGRRARRGGRGRDRRTRCSGRRHGRGGRRADGRGGRPRRRARQQRRRRRGRRLARDRRGALGPRRRPQPEVRVPLLEGGAPRDDRTRRRR